MEHVITVHQGPHRWPQIDGNCVTLMIDRDDGRYKVVEVCLSGQTRRLDLGHIQNDDRIWRAAIAKAADELEILVRDTLALDDGATVEQLQILGSQIQRTIEGDDDLNEITVGAVVSRFDY